MSDKSHDSMVMMVLAQQDAPQGVIDQGGNGQTGELQPGSVDPNATGPAGQGGAGGGQPQASPFTGFAIWIPLIAIFIFILWSSSSSQRKEKRKRETMLASLNKHDKVQTIGGVIGSIVEIKDNEIVLKVDEANNVKMRFSKSAVQQVISESATGAEAATT